MNPKTCSYLICVIHRITCALAFIKIASVTETAISCVLYLQLDSIKTKYFSYSSFHIN